MRSRAREYERKMTDATMTVALITEVYSGEEAGERLRARLLEARREGASLAILPELPLDRWAPATREAREEDAEPPGGRRHAIQAEAARASGLALVGGAIVVDPASGRRHNTALVFDGRGEALAAYRKLHLPQEEGFWEASHYEPGDEPPGLVEVPGLRLGLQICSDANRPALALVPAALGADLVACPRATPPGSYERWKLVLRANAVTGCSYVASVNRPEDRAGTDIGGPSLLVAPDGEVLLESTEPLALATLERERLSAAREDYPGYLDLRADLYARAWERVARR
jgi:predicted amidohydrolase